MDVGEAAWAKLVAVGVAIEGGPGGRDGGERRNGFSVVTKSSSSDADQKFPRCQSCGPCTVGGSRASQTRFQVLVGKPQPRRCGADASPNCVIGLQDVASSSTRAAPTYTGWQKLQLGFFSRSFIPGYLFSPFPFIPPRNTAQRCAFDPRGSVLGSGLCVGALEGRLGGYVSYDIKDLYILRGWRFQCQCQ